LGADVARVELVPFLINLKSSGQECPLYTIYAIRGNSLTRSGLDEGAGILRLRMQIHEANLHAPLRMTGRLWTPQQLKPCSWLGANGTSELVPFPIFFFTRPSASLRAGAEAALFRGIARFRASRGKIKVKVKGSGRGRPLYAGRVPMWHE